MVVFKIFSKVSGQNYVGSCRGDIYERWAMYLDAAAAGLDFPLYNEIRAHGEAEFSVSELDYAEDIAELKEMELLHTVELGAKSLRSHKFGLTESVIKRRRMVDRETAWTKELPPEERPLPKVVAKPTTTSVTAQPPKAPITAKPINAKSVNSTSLNSRPLDSSPVNSKPANSKPANNTTPIRAKQGGADVGATKPRTATANIADASAELDKALFAESIGLLVRTLASVEQLSSFQQQARDEAQSLNRVLAESGRALQQLQLQQDDAATKARHAVAAVEASQQANAALMDAHQQARACSASALQALDQSHETSLQAAQLQRELTGLLGRLKTGASATQSGASATQPGASAAQSEASATPSTAPATQPAPVAVNPTPAAAPFAVTPAKTDSQPRQAMTSPVAVICEPAAEGKPHLDQPNPDRPVMREAAVSEFIANKPAIDQQSAEQHVMAAEEAKMSNQLKQLHSLMNQDSAAVNTTVSPDATAPEMASSEPVISDPTTVKKPARAWVAPSGGKDEPSQLLSKQPSVATVIRRRAKPMRPHSQTRDALSEPTVSAAMRPQLSRKTLRIKSS